MVGIESRNGSPLIIDNDLILDNKSCNLPFFKSNLTPDSILMG